MDLIGTVGSALAVVAFADQCVKYGNKFVKRCKSYLHAEQEAVELLTAIDYNWVKTKAQIEFLAKVAGSLDERYHKMQSQVLAQLEGKLKTATLTIDQLLVEKLEESKGKSKDKQGKNGMKSREEGREVTRAGSEKMSISRKAKYVCKKESLYKIVEEIEKWQARFDPTWMLIMQMSSGKIDEVLSEEQKKSELDRAPFILAAKRIRDLRKEGQSTKIGSTWINSAELDTAYLRLPYSSVLKSSMKSSEGMVLVDTMVCNPAADINSTSREVRNLARFLAEVEPATFGLLNCQGVVEIHKEHPKTENTQTERGDWNLSVKPLVEFKFVFAVPKILTEPRSLRALLVSAIPYPLSERLALAQKLTRSIFFIHTVQFVHKNIRPETVIVFREGNSDIGSPFLAGFENFRLEEGQTYKVGDNLWEQNLYRHPSRQGVELEIERYQMQHDIYSLGVVLLEIGLWKSFLVYNSKDTKEEFPHTADSIPQTPIPSSLLTLQKAEEERHPIRRAFANKAMLEHLAEQELPFHMGKRYTDIVLLCLRCLDMGAGERRGFGTRVDDEELEDGIIVDGVIIGERFIKNMLDRIHEILM